MSDLTEARQLLCRHDVAKARGPEIRHQDGPHLRPRKTPVVASAGIAGSRPSQRTQSWQSLVVGSSFGAPSARQLQGHAHASSHIGHDWWSVGSAHLHVCGRRRVSITSSFARGPLSHLTALRQQRLGTAILAVRRVDQETLLFHHVEHVGGVTERHAEKCASSELVG